MSVAAEKLGTGYEASDASPRPIVLAGLGVLILTVAAMAAVALGLRTLFGQLAPPGLAAADRFTHGPEARSDIAEAWTRLEREQADLDAYGWVDRPRGVVHVPISRAMDLVANEPAADVHWPETEAQP